MTTSTRSLQRQFHQFFLGLLLGLSLLTVLTTAGTLVAYYGAAVAGRTAEVRLRFEAAVRELEESLLNRTKILSDVARIEGMGLVDARPIRQMQLQTLSWLKHDGLQVTGQGDRVYWEAQGVRAGAIQRAFLGVPTVQLQVSEEGVPALLAATPVEGTGGVGEVVVTTLPLGLEQLETLSLRAGGEIALFDAQGRLLSSSLVQPDALRRVGAALVVSGEGATVRVGGARYAFRTFPLRIGQRSFGSFAVLWPVDDLRALTLRLAAWPLVAVAAALSLFFVLYRRVIAATIHEMSALTVWARSFSPEDPIQPPELPRVEELEVLSRAFSDLVRDLEVALHEVAVKNHALEEVNVTLEGKVSIKTRELEDQRRLLDSVLSGMSQAVVLLEADGRVSYANPAARQLFDGFGEDELSTLCSPREDASLARETELVHRGRTFLVSLTPVGEGGRRIWVAQDVTVRRNLEQQLQQSQRLESVGRLAGGVAHDFNNVLGSIVPCVDILRRRTSDPKSLSYLETIESAAARASDVVRQLLTFSRSGEFRPQPLDLNDAVEGALKLLRPGLKQVKLRWTPAAGLPLVHADETQIQQVVINLAINAVDAMQGSGTLQVATSPTAAGWVQLSVEDTGPGIPVQNRTKVFDPFFTTKEPGKGTGLGLSIAYGVVERHGGRVRVAPSEADRGARLEVELPPLERRDEATQDLRLANHANSVLLVDDDPMLLDTLSEALGSFGFRVSACQGGAQALEQFERETPDVAVVDLRMPGMSGVELAHALRSRRPGLKIVFMSGFMDEPAEDLQVFGDVPTLSKPFAPSELARILRAASR